MYYNTRMLRLTFFCVIVQTNQLKNQQNFWDINWQLYISPAMVNIKVDI